MTEPQIETDMCETCESPRREDGKGQWGHHTYAKHYCGFAGLAIRGQRLWFCSPTCLRMTPVPTIDDNIKPGEVNHIS
jgi:hypothetical protein